MTSNTGTSSRPVTARKPAPSAAKASPTPSSSSADPLPSDPSPQEDYMQPKDWHFCYDYLRFTFSDINGIARSKLVPEIATKQQIKDGVFIFAGCLAMSTRGDVTPVEEAVKLNYGNCVARAMPETRMVLPWVEQGKYMVAQVLCETYWINPFRNGAHQDACPRYMARKQLEHLMEKGYTLYSAFEPEFMVFKRGTLIPVIDGMDVCASLRQAEVEEYACVLNCCLTKNKINLSGFLLKHGQMEFSLDPSFGVETADQLFWFKEAVKELSLLKDWQATFMAKPFPEASTNGLHFNHSLWSIDGQQNLFANPSDPDGLSGVVRHWVAGLTKHAMALSAICCPTVNCYRRLHTPWAPDKTNWGMDDRFASFRVKTYGSKGAHVESRLPSGAANPYLVLAATVAAGLDGVINRLECPPPRGKDTASDLPRSLREALDALQEDEWMRASLGEEFIRWFVQMKLESEIKPTEEYDLDSEARFDLERKLYFDLI